MIVEFEQNGTSNRCLLNKSRAVKLEECRLCPFFLKSLGQHEVLCEYDRADEAMVVREDAKSSLIENDDSDIVALNFSICYEPLKDSLRMPLEDACDFRDRLQKTFPDSRFTVWKRVR